MNRADAEKVVDVIEALFVVYRATNGYRRALLSTWIDDAYAQLFEAGWSYVGEVLRPSAVIRLDPVTA